MEVRICTGPLEDIKAELSGEDEYDRGLAQLDNAFEASQDANVVYELAGKTRNQNIQPKLAKILENASIKSGYKIVVFSGGQVSKADGGVDGRTRTGSNRHDNGYAADIRVIDNGTRLSAENSATFDRLSKFVKLLKSEGIESVGAGPGYMNGNLHVDIAASVGQGPSTTWGAGGRSANTPSWLKSAFV